MMTLKNLTLAHLTISSTPAATIDAAAAAGFGAVGLRICGRRPGDAFETPVIGHPETARALRRQAAERGIRLSNISAYQFYPDVVWEDVAPVVDALHELGAPIVVVNGFDPDEARFIDLFARYSEAAAAAGIRVALEFLPYSGVRDLAAARRVVEQAGLEAAGLLLDVLHLVRSGGAIADIAALPPDRIVFAQVCDARSIAGPRPSDEALLHEARHARLAPGRGDLPVFEFLDALPEGLEIEYEVARQDLADASSFAKGQAAATDATAFLAAYAEHHQRRRLS